MQLNTSYPLIEIELSFESRQTLGNKLISFTLKYPESGTLPQFLFSQLLNGIFRGSNVKVIGGDESVFATNTTSKKPADIWLEVNGIQTNLYEITVKPVSKKRLDDCLEALKSTGHLNNSVTFICRLPDDVKELDVLDGSYKYKGKPFDFVDYESFCCSMCALLSNEDFSIVMTSVSSFIKNMHVSTKTKEGWNLSFGGEY